MAVATTLVYTIPFFVDKENQSYLFSFTSGKRKLQWQRKAVSYRWLICIIGLKVIAIFWAFILLYFSSKEQYYNYLNCLQVVLAKSLEQWKKLHSEYRGRNAKYIYEIKFQHPMSSILHIHKKFFYLNERLFRNCLVECQSGHCLYLTFFVLASSHSRQMLGYYIIHRLQLFPFTSTTIHCWLLSDHSLVI